MSSGKGSGLVRSFGLGIVLPAVVVALWWCATSFGWVVRLPYPQQVVETLWNWIFGTGPGPYDGTWLESFLSSGARVLVGFLVAAVLGVVLGVLAGYFKTFGQMVDPLVQILRPIPSTAWVPLTLVFFGFGFEGAVFLIALGTFFPIFVNTIEGVRGVKASLLRVGRMLGARTDQLLLSFVLPSALPNIFTGLRLGVGLAWVLVVVAEMGNVRNGLGYTLHDAYSMGRYDVIIAAMISLGVLGFATDRVVVLVQNTTLKWHREMSIHAE